jgi:hypothetical protein
VQWVSIAQVIGSLLVSAMMCGIKLSVIAEFPDIFKRSKELKLTLSMLQHDDPEVQACGPCARPLSHLAQ